MKYYAKQSCLKFKLPLLIGISRKSMIYKELNSTKEALNGTTVLNTVALTKGQIFSGCTM
jgi:dihydropteroate synthase